MQKIEKTTKKMKIIFGIKYLGSTKGNLLMSTSIQKIMINHHLDHLEIIGKNRKKKQYHLSDVE